MAKITNLQLAEWALDVWQSGRYAYWYGTFGQKCSNSLYNSKKKQYPGHYTEARASGYKADINNGKRCLDCIGLLKAAAWTECGEHEPKYGTNGCPDKSADGMLAYCKAQGMKNGKIKTLPDVPGIFLHKSGHAGVTIGGGWAIEAMSFANDIKKTKISDRGWTEWSELPFIEYVEGSAGGTEWALGDRVLSRGLKGPDVMQLQAHFKALGGYNLGKAGKNGDGVDGDFGPLTMAAVMIFEERALRPVDGIFDGDDYEALLRVLDYGYPAEDDHDSSPDDTGEPEPEPEPEDDPDDDAPEGKAKYVRITGGTVNIRQIPSTNVAKLGTVKNGAMLPYTGVTKDGWHGVVWNGREAWVSGKYSSVVEEPKLILDISEYNNVTNWDLVEDNVAFMWLRVGLRSKTKDGPVKIDTRFKEYAAECKARGIPFGVYFFGRGNTTARTREEAQATAKWAEPFGPKVYAYDAEVDTLTHDSIQAYVDELKKLTGRPVGGYIAHHRYNQYRAKMLDLAYIWIPRYGSNDGTVQNAPAYPWDVHQFSSRGKCPGISGNVDVNRLSGTKSLAFFRNGGKGV